MKRPVLMARIDTACPYSYTSR